MLLGSPLGYVRLVGQEPAPSKCVLLSTSRAVRKDMKDWVLSQEEDQWSVKIDIGDLGRHLDTTFRGWSATVATRVRLVTTRLVLIFAPPLDFHGRVRVSGLCIFRLLFMGLKPLAYASFVPPSTGWYVLVVSLWLVLVQSSASWMSLLGVTLLFAWFGLGFVCFLGILLFGPLKLAVLIVYWRWLVRGALGMGQFTAGAAESGFRWDLLRMSWSGPGFLLVRKFLVLFSISKLLFLSFRCGPLLVFFWLLAAS